jgi:hypothetical protein
MMPQEHERLTRRDRLDIACREHDLALRLLHRTATAKWATIEVDEAMSREFISAWRERQDAAEAFHSRETPSDGR